MISLLPGFDRMSSGGQIGSWAAGRELVLHVSGLERSQLFALLAYWVVMYLLVVIGAAMNVFVAAKRVRELDNRFLYYFPIGGILAR